MQPIYTQTISNNLITIKKRIQEVALKAKRDPETIQLLAVSKFNPVSAIQAALAAKQYYFGENRIQEAQEKFSFLRQEWPQLRLHIIGALQTNKIIDAVRISDVIETIDRPKLLDPLERAADKTGRLPILFIQINTGSESQKAGVIPDQADSFIETCCKKFGNSVQGVMGIPPINEDPMPHFQLLTQLAKRYQLPEISMGMSADFEQAIIAGATIVRVGSAIFGERAVTTGQSHPEKFNARQ